MVTNTEIHFLPVDECHTHVLSRDTMHWRLDGQVCFYRQLFCDTIKPRGCISWPVWPLRGINKTAWGAKLILTADLIHPFELCQSGSPTDGTALPFLFESLLWPAYGSPPAPITHPTPSHPPPIDSICVTTDVEKITSKTWGIQTACRISYEILAI